METHRNTRAIMLIAGLATIASAFGCDEPKRLQNETTSSNQTVAVASKSNDCTVERAMVEDKGGVERLASAKQRALETFERENAPFVQAFEAVKGAGNAPGMTGRVPEVVVEHQMLNYHGAVYYQDSHPCLLSVAEDSNRIEKTFQAKSWAEYLAITVGYALEMIARHEGEVRDYDVSGFLSDYLFPGTDMDERRGVALAFVTPIARKASDVGAKGVGLVEWTSAAVVKIVGKPSRGIEKHLRFAYGILATDFTKLDRDVRADELAYDKACKEWEAKVAKTPDGGVEPDAPEPKYSFGYKQTSLGFALRRWREPNGPVMVKNLKSIVESVAKGIGMTAQELSRPLPTEESPEWK